MKSTHLVAVANVFFLLGNILPARASSLYSASSKAILTFLNSPLDTVISHEPENPLQRVTIENNFGTAGDATAIINEDVDDLSSIEPGESLEALATVSGSAPPNAESFAQSTIGVFFSNFSTEDVIFEFKFTYNLAAEINIDDPALDSANARAFFDAKFGYGFIPGGPTELPPVPIEDIAESVMSNEPSMSVETIISFPVPAQVRGAVSFTATTNGDSEIISEKVPESTSVLSFLALSSLGVASTLKRKLKPSEENETTKRS